MNSLQKSVGILLLFLGLFRIQASEVVVADSVHEVTVFVMPTLLPINWESPAILLRTAKTCFYKTLSVPDNYLLGHIALCLNTPLLPSNRLLAMTAANKPEEIDLILKQKIGLAILGATLQGKIESDENLRRMIQVYRKREKLAFIRFRVGEAAMKQMLDFIQAFSRYDSGEHHPSEYYGGAFWPLYTDEGAGCSGFALGVLASAGLLPSEADQWMIRKNIPMELIGGEYNHHKKVSFRKISKTTTWYDGNGVPNVDFVYVQTYEPSILYDWILDKRSHPDSSYLPCEEEGTPGLLVDMTDSPIPSASSLFSERPQPNLFIDIYRKKAGIIP
jgi:hypothetical protein